MGRSAQRLWLAAGLLVLLSPSAARASAPPRVGVRVFGVPAQTAAPLAEALREGVVAAGAELVEAEALRATERRLKLPRRTRERTESLLRGAREAGATHLLVVRLRASGRGLTAKIEFFEVEGERLRTKGQLRWNKTRASARKLAKPLMERLLAPLLEGPEPPSDPEPPPPAETAPEPETEPETAPAPESETEPVPLAAEPSPAPEPPPAPIQDVELEVPPPRARAQEHLRVVLAAGSKLVRSYQLRGGGGAPSGLSFDLAPNTSFGAELELRWPWPILGLVARGSFSPVRYQVRVDGAIREEPAGFLLDGSAQLRLHLALSEAWSLLPGLGARLNLAEVQPHRGNFVVSQLGFAPELAVAVRFSPSAQWELNAGLTGGYLLGFREAPVGSGRPGPGFVAASDLGLRMFITPAFGLALDARFELLELGFTGSPDRQLPEAEALLDARLRTLELQLQLGVALRI